MKINYNYLIINGILSHATELSHGYYEYDNDIEITMYRGLLTRIRTFCILTRFIIRCRKKIKAKKLQVIKDLQIIPDDIVDYVLAGYL